MQPRWRTFEPGIEAEQAERDRLLALMDCWWEAFAGKAGEIIALFQQRAEWNLPAWMRRNLNAISPKLM